MSCASTQTGDDLAIAIEETSFESGQFVVTFARSKPTAIYRAFCANASWSSHFFDFADAAMLMHVHTRAEPAPGDMPGDDNAQLFATAGGTPTLDVQSILCVGVIN